MPTLPSMTLEARKSEVAGEKKRESHVFFLWVWPYALLDVSLAEFSLCALH